MEDSLNPGRICIPGPQTLHPKTLDETQDLVLLHEITSPAPSPLAEALILRET